MPHPAHARLTIEFDLRADPIAGVVHDGRGGDGQAFAGWMALTRAIEVTLGAARLDSQSPPADTTSAATPGETQ